MGHKCRPTKTSLCKNKRINNLKKINKSLYQLYKVRKISITFVQCNQQSTIMTIIGLNVDFLVVAKLAL